MLANLIPSKTRRKILSLFFQNIDTSYHLRRVGREVEEEINAVKRELDILEGAHVLKKERRLNKSIYSLNPSYIFFDELLSIFLKESAMSKSIVQDLSKKGKLKFVGVSKKFMKKEKITESEIYILFIGIVPTPEVSKIVEVEEKTYPYEINFTVMTEDEFKYRKKNNDPFVWTFLRQPKVMLIGQEEGLVS